MGNSPLYTCITLGEKLLQVLHVKRRRDAAPLVQVQRQCLYFALSPFQKNTSWQNNKFQYRESLTQTEWASSKQLQLKIHRLEFKVGEVSEACDNSDCQK